ncbi:hypothetical protein [Streptomyces sp. NPDC055005]
MTKELGAAHLAVQNVLDAALDVVKVETVTVRVACLLACLTDP